MFPDPQSLRASVSLLQNHLQLVEPVIATGARKADGETPRKWRIADGFVGFWARVLAPDRDARNGGGDPAPRAAASGLRSRMDEYEGGRLERLAAEVFRDWLVPPGAPYSVEGNYVIRSGAWRIRTDAEIDLVAYDIPKRDLWIGNVKRNASRHDPVRFGQQIERYFRPSGAGERGIPDRSAWNERRLLVSPEFTAEQRRHWKERGLDCLDIPQMAAMLLDHGPGPGQEDG